MSECYQTISGPKCNIAEELDRLRKDVEFKRQDIRLLTIALNLSSRRTELEGRAGDIMEDHGPLKGLALSKRSTTERFVITESDKRAASTIRAGIENNRTETLSAIASIIARERSSDSPTISPLKGAGNDAATRSH